MAAYLRTNELVKELLQRIEDASIEVLAAYYDIHHHPKRPENPAWQVISALIAAASRGARVRLLLPAFKYNKNNQRTAQYLSRTQIQVRILPTTHRLHAKIMIVDKQAVLLGSHNLSRPGLSINIETAALLTDPHDIYEARQDFYRWWKAAKKLTEEQGS